MIQSILEIIAPDDCLVCGQEGSLWCLWCQDELDPIPSRCFRCQEQTNNNQVCKKCRKTVPIKQVYIAAEYDDVAKQLVKAMKFKSKRQATKIIATKISETLPYFDQNKIVLTYVPTSNKHIRQRGFDHSKLIAKEVSKQLNLKLRVTIERTNSLAQVGTDKKLRQQQIKGAFRFKGQDLFDKTVILIDDVITTGATITEAAKIIKTAKPKQIIVAAFAYTAKH